MSRSIPTKEKASNPCKNWLQWSSKTKMFTQWDKEAPNPQDPSKPGMQVAVPLPFKFLVLDQLTCIAGFTKADPKDAKKVPVMSNEVRIFQDSKDGRQKAEQIAIRVKGTEVVRGVYADIIDKVKGAKFANSVYIGMFDKEGNLVLGNLKLFGASVGAWIDSSNIIRKAGKKVEECAFVVKTTKEGLEGDNVFYAPVFEEIKCKEETNAKAIELDKVLQAYLAEYFANPEATNSTLNEVVEDKPTATESLMAEETAGVVTAQSSGLPPDFDEEF